MTWKIGIICAGDRAIFKEHHTKDNNASLQGRIELGQEVGAPYCFTGYEHRRGGISYMYGSAASGMQTVI
ncbi:hypothetical protein [Lutispora sp.]|uniref:hypothetical protein n=1 Tax=Lutispora sp. TaxID=2828727 RepID=UPI002B1ECF79|nr:hypothetical protein [Lutispora sp.]MEA4960852.1 hypothetical protein [Lutispora sp.]